MSCASSPPPPPNVESLTVPSPAPISNRGPWRRCIAEKQTISMILCSIQKFLAFPQPHYVLRMSLTFGHFSASWLLIRKKGSFKKECILFLFLRQCQLRLVASRLTSQAREEFSKDTKESQTDISENEVLAIRHVQIMFGNFWATFGVLSNFFQYYWATSSNFCFSEQFLSNFWPN